MGICCLGFLWLWRARNTEQNSMAEKRKDASSSKENEELNGRRGPGGGLEPRTHAPFIEDHTTWGGGSGDGSAGLTTEPGS